jgi:hypothetical protein
MNKFIKTSPGFSLLETLVYVVLVAVGVNLCAVLLRSSSQLTALNVLAMDRLNVVVDLEEVVTESIQEAVGVAEAAGEYRSSENCLVLQLPPRNGADRFAVLGDLRGTKQLSRFVLARKDQEWTLEAARTWRVKLASIRFEHKDGLITFDGALHRESGERDRVPLAFRCMAAPRSLWRGDAL